MSSKLVSVLGSTINYACVSMCVCGFFAVYVYCVYILIMIVGDLLTSVQENSDEVFFNR